MYSECMGDMDGGIGVGLAIRRHHPPEQSRFKSRVQRALFAQCRKIRLFLLLEQSLRLLRGVFGIARRARNLDCLVGKVIEFRLAEKQRLTLRNLGSLFAV